MTGVPPESGISSLEYRPDADVYEATFDPASTTPSMAIVATLSRVRNLDQTDLEPLYGAVDTDALDSVLARRWRSSDLEVTFSHREQSITVTDDGVITVSSTVSKEPTRESQGPTAP